MKRSKIFLGVTTCFLAVAAVAATKVANFKSTKAGYFVGTNCVLYGISPCTTTKPSDAVCKTSTSKVKTLYSYNSLNQCGAKLFTSAE
jgi:hypothetical protein